MNYKEQLNKLSQKFSSIPGFGIRVLSQELDTKSNSWVVTLSDGRKINQNSPEYKELESTGLIHMDTPNKITHVQSGKLNPELQRYLDVEKQNPFNEFLKSRDSLGQNYSQDPRNAPQEYKNDYDTFINKKWAQDFFEKNPMNEGEERGAYLNRVTNGMEPSIVENLYNYMPARELETNWQMGEKGVAALTDLKGIPGLENFSNLEDYIQESNHLSDYEKSKYFSDLKENPNSTRVMTALGTLAPLGILAETVVAGASDDYSLEDARRGIQNNVSPWVKAAVDPLNLVGLELFSKLGSVSKFSKGLSAVNSFDKEERGFKFLEGLTKAGKIIQKEGLPTLKATVKGYAEGLKKGFTEPGEIDRFILAESSLTRPEVKELREIQSLSSLSMDSKIDQITLYNKYLKSSLNDVNLKRVTGKTRSEIQDRLNYMMSEKKEVFDLDPEPVLSASEFLRRPPREAGLTVNRNNEIMNTNSIEYNVREKFLDTSVKGASDATRLRNIFSKRKDLSSFVDIKPKGDEEVKSLLPSLFKQKEISSDEITKRMMGAFSEVKNADKGYYNASSSISDSSAPLYYTNASRLGSEKNIAFEIDGFTQLNNYGYLNKAGVEKSKILDFMNNHISNLDFKGKKLPKAYLDEAGEIQIPNLLIKKFLQGGKLNFEEELLKRIKNLSQTQQKGGTIGLKDQLQNLAQKYQTGGTISEQKTDSKEFYDAYLNSERYKTILRKEWEGEASASMVDKVIYPDIMDRYNKSLKNINQVKSIDNNPNILGMRYESTNDPRKNEDYYYKIHPTKKGQIEVTNKGLKQNSTVVNHEISHNIDNSGEAIPTNSIIKLAQILKGIKPLGYNKMGYGDRIMENKMFPTETNNATDNYISNYNEKTKEDYNKILGLNDYYGNMDNYIPFGDHEITSVYDNINFTGIPDGKGNYKQIPVAFRYESDPTEFKARLQSTRQQLFKEKIYDASKRDFTDSDYDNLLNKMKDYDLNSRTDTDIYEFMREIQGSYDDSSNEESKKKHRENTIWIMNNLAKNQPKSSIKYSQKGGTIGLLKDQLQNLAQKYQVGGQTPSTQEDWKQKYSTNPYFKDREDWGESLDKKFPNAKNTVRQSIYAASKRTGIDPGLLYTSAMEEGMKLALTGKDTGVRRQGFIDYQKSSPKAREYPIDGGYYYGLNTFGDKYGKTIKQSNLPPGFKYTPYPQKGIDGSTAFNSAAFRTHEDAISAKAAQMKQVEEAMNYKLKDAKINLSPEARKFFDMVGYNMGEEKTIEMIKSYQQKGYLKDDRFLDPSFQPASWKEPYTNVQRRYQNYRILNEQGYFKDYDTPNPKVAVTGSTKEPNSFQVGGEIENMLSKLNPKNWFKEDYSDSKSYGEAYKKAKRNGNEEFMYKNKRYNTNYNGTPRQEAGAYTNAKDLNNPTKVFKYPALGSHNGHISAEIDDSTFVDFGPFGNVKTSKNDVSQSFNVFNNDKNVFKNRANTLPKRTDITNISKKDWVAVSNNCADNIADAFGLKRSSFMELPSNTLNKIKNKYPTVETTGRTKTDYLNLSEDIKNKKSSDILSQSKNLIGLSFSPDLKGEISQNIISTVQRALSEKGYDLSSSVKKDGNFDGVYGNETEKALQDWQSKNTKKFQVGGQTPYPQKGGIPNLGQLLTQKPKTNNVLGNIKLSQEQFDRNEINNRNKLNNKLNNTETANTFSNMLGNVNQYFLGNTDSSLQKSLYKPTISKEKNAVYYTRPGMRNDVYNDLISEKVRKDYNHTGEFDDIFTALKNNGSDRPNTAKDSFPNNKAGYKGMYNKGHGSFKGEFNLGRYTIDAGEDANGKYISYHDVYDWNGSQTENKINFYDRIYEKDWKELKNKKPQVNKKQSGGMIRSELDNLALKYS